MPLADVPVEAIREARQTWYRSLGYTPKLGQRLMDEAVDSGKRVIGYFTPPQDGKSFGVAKHVGVYTVVPDTHIWIVAPKYEDGAKEFGYLRQDLARMGMLRRATRNYFDIRGNNMLIELPNKTWIQVVTLADGTDNLRKEQVDVVIFAEASKMPINPLPSMYARVEKRRGKAFYPSTHKGYGWMYSEVRMPSLPVKDKTFQWSPWDGDRRQMLGGEPNPDYDPEYWSCQVSYVREFGDVLHTGEYTPEQIERARKRLPPPFFAEQFGGEAASYAGLVYPFDPTKHECEPFEVPNDWTHVVGYDHGAGGGSDPTAILFGSYSPQYSPGTSEGNSAGVSSGSCLYWWGEIYDTQIHSVTERAGYIRIKLSGKTPAAIVRGGDAKQVGEELRRTGLFSWHLPDGQANPTARIIRMTELMQAGKWKILRGRCPNLRREILAYEWDEKNPGKPIDGNDHCLEAAGMASLAPVSLPGSGSKIPEAMDPESIAERIRKDRLWGDMERERKDRDERQSGTNLSRLLDPDPLEEETLVAEAYSPW